MELAVDRSGIPLGAATDAACVHEVNLGPAALADIPPVVDVPWGVPVLADRAYDSDPLRERLDLDGYRLLARHRANRTKPPTNDGRRLRRLRRRWVVERTFAWVKAVRRVATRYEVKCHLYDGFVSLACAFIALNRL
ncbi:MAG: transposase [Gemmataceae bacterium]